MLMIATITAEPHAWILGMVGILASAALDTSVTAKRAADGMSALLGSTFFRSQHRYWIESVPAVTMGRIYHLWRT
jgi:hypothetical protein